MWPQWLTKKKDPAPPELWAFWAYDTFPYMLSGRVEQQHADGTVAVLGYDGALFKPLYMASGDAGRRMHEQRKLVQQAGRWHAEKSLNGARSAAREHLLTAGFPAQLLGKLGQNGQPGPAYAELFNKLLGKEPS